MSLAVTACCSSRLIDTLTPQRRQAVTTVRRMPIPRIPSWISADLSGQPSIPVRTRLSQRMRPPTSTGRAQPVLRMPRVQNPRTQCSTAQRRSACQPPNSATGATTTVTAKWTTVLRAAMASCALMARVKQWLSRPPHPVNRASSMLIAVREASAFLKSTRTARRAYAGATAYFQVATRMQSAQKAGPASTLGASWVMPVSAHAPVPTSAATGTLAPLTAPASLLPRPAFQRRNRATGQTTTVTTGSTKGTPSAVRGRSASQACVMHAAASTGRANARGRSPDGARTGSCR